MANYYDKNRKAASPGDSAFVRDEGEGDKLPPRGKLPPSDPTVQNPGEPNVSGMAPDGGPPVQTLGGMTSAPGNPVPAPTGGVAGAPAATPLDTVNRVSEAIANGSLMNSPYMQQIAANRDKLIALKMQPTYTDKNGKVVQGMQDKNGRMKSGLRAMLENLAQNTGPTREWGDLLAKVSGSISAGVTGAIVPNWDENVDRLREIDRLERETREMMGMAEWDSKMQTQDVNRQNTLGDNARAAAKDKEMVISRQRRDIIHTFNSLSEFDPTDPDNAEMVAAMREVGLPVLPKTAQVSFKYITNAATGEVYVDKSDKAGNRQLIQLTNDDGTPFTSTTPQMMTAADKAEQRKLQERLANNANITRMKIANLGATTRKDVAAINQQGAAGRQDARSADEAAKVLAAIRQNAPKGTSEDDIKKAQQRYLDGLRPEIRDKLPQP